MSSAVENSVTVVAVKRRGRPRRQYECGFCAKAFKRSEHCIRHERVHTQEKPFVCRYCRKTYSRKDLVTRHEKTLHAKAHQQRLQQDQDQDQDQHQDAEHVAEQVNVACSVLVQPLALDTPPDDEPEADQAADGENGNASQIREPPSPGNEGSFSLSPSSSSSPNLTVSYGHHASLSDASRASAHDIGFSENTTVSDVPASTITTSATTCHLNPLPSTAHAADTEAHPYALAHPTQQTDPDHTSFDAHTGDQSVTEMMDTNIVTGMSQDADVQMSEAIGDVDLAQQRLAPHLSQSSGSMEQGPMQSFFSPMPSFDIDLSAFTFSPLPNHPAHDLNHHSLSDLPDGLGAQRLTAQGNQIVSNFDNQLSHLFPYFEAPNQPTDEQDSPKSNNSSCGLPVLEEKRQAYTSATLDDVAYESIQSDLLNRWTTPDTNVEIPSARVCQSFLSSYISSFHGHLPIIHLQSFSPKSTPSPLILAMCSIGALYRLDRRRSRHLYEVAIRSLDIVPRPPEDSDVNVVKDHCLWYAQARLLLSFYAIMSGDKDLILGTMHDNGYYTLVYNKARTSLAGHNADMNRITWQQWIERESWKRLLGGLFLTSTLTMVLFNVNPGFNATQDLEFEAFHDEAMWDATSSTEWRQIKTSILNKYQGQPCRMMKEVLVDIMLEGRYHGDNAPYQVSAFSALVLMHGVVIQMWQMLQVSHAMLAITGPDFLGSSLMDSAMKTLARCDAFLKSTGSELGGLDPEDDEQTSLIFNCQAVLRIAYIRLFKNISPSSPISLISTDPAEMDEAITSFVTNEIERSPQMLNAVTKCLEGLRIPVKLGAMLVRKTAAFRWSVEHAIAGWESALLVTRWIHSVEIASLNGAQPSPEEQKLLALVREVLEEADCDLSESFSLAAGAARTWGWFLQDVWVWGITPGMGAALDQLAKGYETAGEANRRPFLHSVQSLL